MAYVAKTKKRVYYKNAVVVEQAVNGTYQFTPEKDVLAEITLVGAGAGGAFNSSSNRSSAAAGGSGSGCIILAALKAGQTYNAVVGKGGVVVGGLDATATGGRGGNSYIEVVDGAILATAEGGIGGNVWWPNGSSQGAPAPLPTVNTADANIEFQKWLFSKQGIPGAIGGNPSAGGPSVLDGTTYGQGGQAWNAGGSSRGEVGKDGYVKIVYKEPVNGPENLDVLTYTDWQVDLKADVQINIPAGKDGNVNKFLTVTTRKSTAYLSTGDEEYLYINVVGDIFSWPVQYFFFQEEQPTVTQQNTYWYKPSENIWRRSGDTGATWQIYEMGIIGRCWQNTQTGDVSDVHYEPYGEWDNYEDVIKSYIAKRKKVSIPQGTFKPNYTVVGSPTVNNGVVSGFSQSNFITLPDLFSPSTNPWEIVIKGNFTDFSSAHGVFISVASSATAASSSIGTISAYGLQIHVRDGKVTLFLSSTGNSWNLVNDLRGITSLITGTDYWIKLVFTGNEYILYLSTTGDFTGEETVECTVTTTTAIYPRYFLIGCNGSSFNEPVKGSIDLKESYIKIRGELWWNCKYNENVYDAISYAVKRKTRRYYKYVYEDWTQPIATAATTVLPEGNMVITAQGNYGSAVPYKAADGNVSTAWVMNEQRTGWWQIKFPYTIKITGLKFYNNQDKNRTNQARFYTSSAKTAAIGDQFTGVNTAGGLTEITGIPSEGIETDTIYLAILSSYSTSSGMSELQITAQRKTGVKEVSASDDYDYYEDILL